MSNYTEAQKKNAFVRWYNSVPGAWKDYFKIVSEEGSILSDVCNLEEYCQDAKKAHEEFMAEDDHFPYGYII